MILSDPSERKGIGKCNPTAGRYKARLTWIAQTTVASEGISNAANDPDIGTTLHKH